MAQPDYFLESEQKRIKFEQQTRRTTLPEFLDGCHVHSFSNLHIQSDPKLSTPADPANAKGKYRPEKMLKWNKFPMQQKAIWNDLISSGFANDRIFHSLITLEQIGETIVQRFVSSEFDL